MKYTVIYTDHAEKDLRKLPRDVQLRILDSMDAFSKNPSIHICLPTRQMKKLKGSHNVPLFSYRIGNYRVIFQLVHEKLVVMVLKIGNRRDIYDDV